MKNIRKLIGIIFLLAAMTSGAEDISFVHKINVPEKYTNGQNEHFDWEFSDIARYIEGYDRYWWACVEIRAKDIDARYPMNCSGTAAATQGCSDGFLAIDKRIDENAKIYGKKRVQTELQKLIGAPRK